MSKRHGHSLVNTAGWINLLNCQLDPPILSWWNEDLPTGSWFQDSEKKRQPKFQEDVARVNLFTLLKWGVQLFVVKKWGVSVALEPFFFLRSNAFEENSTCLWWMLLFQVRPQGKHALLQWLEKEFRGPPFWYALSQVWWFTVLFHDFLPWPFEKIPQKLPFLKNYQMKPCKCFFSSWSEAYTHWEIIRWRWWNLETLPKIRCESDNLMIFHDIPSSWIRITSLRRFRTKGADLPLNWAQPTRDIGFIGSGNPLRRPKSVSYFWMKTWIQGVFWGIVFHFDLKSGKDFTNLTIFQMGWKRHRHFCHSSLTSPTSRPKQHPISLGMGMESGSRCVWHKKKEPMLSLWPSRQGLMGRLVWSLLHNVGLFNTWAGGSEDIFFVIRGHPESCASDMCFLCGKGAACTWVCLAC